MEYQKDSKPRQRRINLKKTSGAGPEMKINEKITQLKDINPMVANMSIKGRIISIWKAQRLNERHMPYSLEFVLQDDQGIYYKISNFEVTENGGRIPLLPHRWKLSFYNTTIVTRIEQIDENVTVFINEPFTLLLDTNEEYQENDAVDVLGIVVGIGDVVAVNSAGSSKIKRTVVIEKEEYETREEYNANEHKIQLFVLEAKPVSPAEFMQATVKKLHTYCVIYETVHSIQYESGWAYIGCKVCSKKVDLIASKEPMSSKAKKLWFCSKCEKTESQVASRFKMIVRVMDESGSAQLVIFDTSVYKMMGLTCWELVEKYGSNYRILEIITQ
ncbi:replication protein A 70 kDa DNA-binding subunit B [Tanacetum coccineum]